MIFGNKCFLITAYCDNTEKINVLSDCIDNIKNLSSFDIIIHTHYPIPPNIQEKVEMVIFDKSNPVLKFPQKAYVFWRKYNNYKLSLISNDYGWAAMMQWKNGYNFVSQMNYEKIFIINYDVFIDDFLFNLMENSLNTMDGVLLYWHEKINMCLCALNKLDLFNGVNLNDYLKKTDDIIEDYLGRIIDSSPYNFKKMEHEEYKEHFYTSMDIQSTKRFKDDDLPRGAISDPFVFFNHPYEDSLEKGILICRYHIGAVFEKNHILSFFFYNVMKKIKLDIYINDNLFFSGEIDDYFYLESSYNYIDFQNGLIDIKILVDGQEFEHLNKLKENCRIELL